MLQDITIIRIEKLYNNFHNKVIEIIAENLCQKRVSYSQNGNIAKLDESGKYYIDSIINVETDHGNVGGIMVEIYNDDMTWHRTAYMVEG